MHDRIATLTMNPAIDATTRVDHVREGEKLRCEEPRRDPGGGGINVARAVVELGGEALALYPAGGRTADWLGDLLDEEEVSRRAVRVEGEVRENVSVIEKDSDRQYRFVMPGPQLSDTEAEACLAALEELDPAPAYLVASGSLPGGVPDDFYARVAERAGKLGARVVLDSSGAALREGAAAGVHLLKPNLRELSHLADRELEDEAAQEAAARDLIADGCAEVVVVSLGAAGVVVVTKDGTERVRAPTVSIRSRIGAGDSTVAGLVLGLARGDDLGKATRLGVAAGAAAVTTPGTELCRRDRTEALYADLLDEM